jgi:hypothetical protein
MSRFKTARRRTLLTLLAMLLSVPPVVAGATSASADSRCTGRISVDTDSRVGSSVGVIYRDQSTAGVLRGGRISGYEDNPIVQYRTPPDRSFKVRYYDLRNNRHLRTDTLDRGGTFNIDPCHWGKVRIIA